MIYGIILIILGLLAAPSLLLAKKPDAKETLDKLAPIQGWLGLIFFIGGVFSIIMVILAMGLLGHGIWGIIWWITQLACALIQTALGFLLGYSLIVKYGLSKNEAAKAKGEQLMAKLQPLQGKVGLLGIIIGVWVIICSFLYTAAYIAATAVA